ncbi:MAG: ribosomal-protein-alanine N-acetyltransferase [Candidatus Mycalebacterium zealandia]|nr:MAG: ribosomal-protein-alanine N-acetyltransferase [Candidatus Mycalebacterium zealandia]
MVEKARKEDVGSIVEMEKICFDRDAWPLKVFEEELSGGAARRATIVRDARGGVIAYCFSRIFIDAMEIFKIAVHPVHRRKGLAKLLLRDALECLKSGTISLEVATDNKEAIMLYCEFGFRRVAVRKNYYQGSGRDALVMEMKVG